MAPIVVFAALLGGLGSDIPGMDLTSSHLLKGFSTSRAPVERIPDGALRSARGRFFHGASEIRFGAYEFKSRKDAEDCVRWRIRTNNALPLYWTANPDGLLTPALELHPRPSMYDGVRFRPVDWKKRPDRDEYFPHHMIAGKIVIEVLASQHREMKRRNPAAYKQRLPDSDLKYRTNGVAQQLVQAAMKVNSNAK